jgi:DNA-binding transcriptional LysR family regulator
MEIRVLRYFLTVVREENISKAADVLHITQPTLSRQLAQLEEELGTQLFCRGPRKITLTSEGMLLRRRAEEIIELMDKTSQEILASEEEVSGTITIGAGELASVETMVELCGSFQEKYPQVKFEFYTATADQVKERMERGLVDIGLLLEPIDMDRFEFLRLDRKENWVVLMRPDSPLAGKESVTPGDLVGLPLLLPSRLNVQSEVANWFGDEFAHLDVRYTGNLSTNSAVAVQKGYVYAVVIEGSVIFWNPELIVAKPLSPVLTATTAFAWRRNQPFPKATSKFIQYMKNKLRHTI